MTSSRRNPGRNSKVNKNNFVTKSGNTIKLNRGIVNKFKSGKDARARKRAAYLSTLPKGRIKRILARLHPKRVYKYWFSRQGAIMALKLTGIGIVTGFLLLVGLFAYFRKDLPNLKDISGNNIGGCIRYYDKTGKTLLWEDCEGVKRVPVGDNISKYLKDATVAVEDKDFFKHGGFDVRGIARAGVNNVTGGSSTQGGSTITQQLVKLTQNWTKDRSYTRKIKELILSVEIERSYSKNEILDGYLNTAPYGNVQYGAESSARDYFQKSAKDLTLDEAAFLASIPKSPSFYSPYGLLYKQDPATSQKALIGRQHYVLDLMAQQGMITSTQRDEAKKVDVIAKVHEPLAKYAGIKAPYFVLAAKASLEDKYQETAKKGGWSVTTTLDLGLQDIAEQKVAADMKQIRSQGGDNAAFIAEDVQTGQIVSLVGGSDFNNVEYGKLNFAATRKVSPGSSFKPYDYATFIDNNKNVGAGSVLYDNQAPLPGYPCTNKQRPNKAQDNGANCLWDYDFNSSLGPLTLRYALGGSRNVPAMKAMLGAVPNDTSTSRVNSVNKTIDTASAMMGNADAYKCYKDGVNVDNASKDDEVQCYGSSAIGDGAYLTLQDHVNGISTLARMGNVLQRTYILKITDSGNKTINEWKPQKGTQVIKPDSAYIVNDMASDPNASYLPSSYKYHRQKNGWHFAVKTGTTNSGFDGLMASWSTKYAAVTWVGYHNRNKTMTGAMEYMTTPITRGWMEAAHASLPPVNWQAPADIKTAPAFVVRNHVGLGSVEPSPANDIYPSWYQPPSKSNVNTTLDSISNKLATSCTPERAKKVSSGASSNSLSVDPFMGGGNADANVTENDNIHKCDDTKPSVTLTATGCSVVATITQGTHALSSDQHQGVIDFIVNGQTVQSANVSASPTSVSYTAAAGTSSVTAQVIDSVLYDSSDTVSLDCTTTPEVMGANTTSPAPPTPNNGH
jgi:membrane peptidoglycan carboxypeptidase